MKFKSSPTKITNPVFLYLYPPPPPPPPLPPIAHVVTTSKRISKVYMFKMVPDLLVQLGCKIAQGNPTPQQLNASNPAADPAAPLPPQPKKAKTKGAVM